MATPMRTLGPTGREVSALGLGGWAIGGPFLMNDLPDGYGDVDDAESLRAIRRAVELGVTLFDTADVYGTGHSERIFGQGLGRDRDQVVIATKFGFTYDEAGRRITGTDLSPDYIRRACEASLRRLGTDRIDLYQLHVNEAPVEAADEIFATLDGLVDKGLIRAYGWSTDFPERARTLAGRPAAAAVQHELNVLTDAPEMLAVCDELGVASLSRLPLAMGLLTGKFTADTKLASNDVRATPHEWMNLFRDGRPAPGLLDRLTAIREVLISGGRTLAQGALAWILARSPITIPIPGCRSVAQVEDNFGALAHGPLTAEQLAEIDKLLDRQPA